MHEHSISRAAQDLIVDTLAETIIKNAGGTVRAGYVNMSNIVDCIYPATPGNTTGQTIYQFQSGTVYQSDEEGKTYITGSLP